MKKNQHIFWIFLLIFPLFSNSQDLISPQQINLSDYQKDYGFNLESDTYQSLIIHLHLVVENNTNFINGEFVSLQLTKNSKDLNAEIARLYLPQIIEKNQKIDYEFDVTLWQSWMKGESEISIVSNTIIHELQFELQIIAIEGLSPILVKEIIPLWKSGTDGFNYNQDGISDELLPEKTIQLPENTKYGFVQIMVSGKQEKDDVSARFYFLKVNGEDQAKRSIWRDDCGLNPIYPQLENWHLERPNWCPGLRVHPLRHFLSDSQLNKKEINIGLDFQKDYLEKSGIESYITSAVLFILEEPTNELNVSISEILAPNEDFWHQRYNPICGSPVILIQNLGKSAVNEITINYGYNYQTDNKFRWRGELGFMEEELVYLPPLNWYFFEQDDEPETFTAHISAVDGKEKAFLFGKKTSQMRLAEVYPYRLTFELKTDEGAAFNGLEIFDDDGNAYFVSGDLKADTTYQFDVNLIPGCYEMVLFDLIGDGIKLKDVENVVLKIKDQKKKIELKRFDGDFGGEIREQFMIFR